jgi:plastocyanin
MKTYRVLLTLSLFALLLIISTMGCNDSGKGKSAETAEQTQTVTTKRAPKTLKAFQNAIETKAVGTIRGRALFKGQPPPRDELPVTFSKRVCGREPKKSERLLVSETGAIQNVVVSLLRIPKGLPPPTSEVPLQLDQQKCVFIPHVLIVPVDTPFEILNSDNTGHNFHAVGTENTEINKNQSKNNRKPIPVQFAYPEVVRVVCDVHSWMSAWIIVAEHPYYALTDHEGVFRLDNVPAGQYQIKAWHETLGEHTSEVTVEVNQEAVADFELSLP